MSVFFYVQIHTQQHCHVTSSPIVHAWCFLYMALSSIFIQRLLSSFMCLCLTCVDAVMFSSPSLSRTPVLLIDFTHSSGALCVVFDHLVSFWMQVLLKELESGKKMFVNCSTKSDKTVNRFFLFFFYLKVLNLNKHWKKKILFILFYA